MPLKVYYYYSTVETKERCTKTQPFVPLSFVKSVVMEKLLQSIPKEIKWETKDGDKQYHGFCLRYSHTKGKWLCGFGLKMSSKLKDKYFVEADDPVEALAFFVELYNKK